MLIDYGDGMQIFHAVMNGLVRSAMFIAKVIFVFATIFVTFICIIFSLMNK